VVSILIAVAALLQTTLFTTATFCSWQRLCFLLRCL